MANSSQSHVTLAFEDDKVVPPFSWEETDNTDDTDDADNTYNTDDTDIKDDADDSDDTKYWNFLE